MSTDSSSKPEPKSATSVAAGPLAMWGPAAALAITFITYASQFLAGIVTGFYALLVGEDKAFLAGGTPAPATQFVLVVCAEILALGVLALFLRARKQPFLRSVGLDFRQFRAQHLGIALVGFLVYFALLFVIVGGLTTLFPRLDTQQDIGFDPLGISQTGLLLAFVSLVILPPIAEEMIFRGFLFGALRGKMKFVYAAAVTSVVFGAAHLLGAESGLLWIGAIDTFLLSLVLCYLREETGNIVASIVVHALKNGMAFLVLFKSVLF